MRSLLLLFCLHSTLLGQNLNSFCGQVTDPSGASVPGAVVRLTQPGGKEQRKNTDSSGNFELRNLPYAKFTVRVERPGFAAYRVDELQVSGTTVFNVQLSLDSQAQVVNVQSEVQGVTTDPLANAGALVLKAEDLEAFSDDPDTTRQNLGLRP